MACFLDQANRYTYSSGIFKENSPPSFVKQQQGQTQKYSC